MLLDPAQIDLRARVQMEPLLLAREDAAAVLGVSPRKLDEWASRGLIGKWKVDGVVRFAVDDLRAFVAANKPKRTAGEGRRPRASNPEARNGVDAPSS